MPKGHAPKRENKKPKKKADKGIEIAPPGFAPPVVEVVRKRRKPKEEE